MGGNIIRDVGYPDVRGERAGMRQLEDLVDGKALAGSVLNAMTRLIAERESAICISSWSSEISLGYEAAARYKLARGVPSVATLQAADLIIAASHDPPFHWTGVVIHLPSLTAIVYDPRSTVEHVASHASGTVRRIIDEAQALCALRELDALPWMDQTIKVRLMLAPRQQPGSLDCGVCAVLGIERIIAAFKGARYDFKTTPDAMLAGRFAMERAITTGSLPDDWPPTPPLSIARGRGQ